MRQLPKISRRQEFFHFMMTSLADGGRKNLDEDAPSGSAWLGLRLPLFRFFQRRVWNEASRLRRKYGITTYRARRR